MKPMIEKSQFGALWLLLAWLPLLACSPEASEQERTPTETVKEVVPTSTGGRSDVEPQSPSETGGQGGELPQDEEEEQEYYHPLFGAGSYPGWDSDDPCETAPLWEPSTSVPHQKDTVVLYEDTLWKITGELNGQESSWVRPECMPPGDPSEPADCGAEYLWVELASCLNPPSPL